MCKENLYENLELYQGPLFRDIIQTYKNILTEEFPRNDYKELAQISLLYLGGEDGDIKFNRPGAMDKSRWMARIIYSLKIVMMENVIEEEFSLAVYSSYNFPTLKKFVNFAALVYVPWWLTSTESSDSPINDFTLVKNISNYSDIDKDCSESALMSLNNHLWYLTPELLPFCLFSDHLDTDSKDRVASKILMKKEKVSTVNILFKLMI